MSGPTYFYGILLVLLAGLVWRLFLRGSESKLKTLYGIITTCFGHPIYLILALYITYLLSRNSESRDLITVAYTTVLLLLFLLRFGFFLYHAWDHTRSPLEKVHPYAAAAYFRAHRYCILGVPMYVCALNGLDRSAGLEYFIVFIVTGMAGIVQSIYALEQAFHPERWAPPDELVVAHNKESANCVPLDPADERKRRLASVIPWCLGVLIIGSVVAATLAGIGEREKHREVHSKSLPAKEPPGTAAYHLALGQSYTKIYPGTTHTWATFKGMYSRALVEYNKAIALDPNLAEAYKQRGHSYRFLEDYARAVEDYNTFERLSEGVDGHLYACRAAAYKGLGMYDKMCEDNRKACDVNYACSDYKRHVDEGLCK